jgi:hypothetical protein
MITENSGRIRRIKQLFYFGAGLMALASLIFFLTGEDVYGFVAAGMVVAWFLVFQFVDFQYVHVETGNVKLTLRYYPATTFGRKDYSTIEFPLAIFYDFKVEKSVFGLVNDLVLVVKTNRGVAEYDPVSMAAVSREEQRQLEQHLRTLLRR